MPRKNITVAAAAKYCNSEVIPEGTPINVAIMNPANIPKPPRVGITFLCTFLSSGSSNNFLSFATWMITGIAKNVIRKASAALSNIYCIRLIYFTVQNSAKVLNMFQVKLPLFN